jgi:cob(I)alamin adenosyltransferase
MVRLNRIYTKTGDDGTTALGDGTRLPKHHLRIEAYGTVDELSSLLGLALVQGQVPEPLALVLRRIQNELFDVGADLCVPGAAGDKLRITSNYTTHLVLPGGHPAAAWLHVARTVCRRAERNVTALASFPEEAERINPEVIRYLNRLSDLLFVFARSANDDGKLDVLWKPGASR